MKYKFLQISQENKIKNYKSKHNMDDKKQDVKSSLNLLYNIF